MTLEQALCAAPGRLSSDIDSQSIWARPETQPEQRLQAWRSK